MEFPIELVRYPRIKGLVLKAFSLPLFSMKPVFVPEEEIQRLGFFDVTYKNYYDIQQIESGLSLRGIKNANAYREIRTIDVKLENPYRILKKTTFQSYHIPEKLAKKERDKAMSLALSCTS